MTLIQFIDRALFIAPVGTALGDNPTISQDIEAQALAGEALNILSERIAADSGRRHLLQKSTSVALTSGIGTLDTSLLSEWLGDGWVKDGEDNVLCEVPNYFDLQRPLSPLLGYYTLQNKQIHTKQVVTGSLTDTATPLTVFCSFTPTATQVPTELEEEAVRILADLLIGYPKKKG